MNQALGNRETQALRATSSIAMIVLLVSFTMLFSTLLLGHIVFRLTSDVWPPMGMPKADLLYPTISTVIIALSSYFLFQVERIYKESGEFSKQNYFLSLLFGIGFLVIQSLLWSSLKEQGLYVSGGVFPSLLFGLTWTHAAHIVLGVLVLIALFPAMRVKSSVRRLLWLENVSKFWHFLGVVWLVMYLIMFVF